MSFLVIHVVQAEAQTLPRPAFPITIPEPIASDPLTPPTSPQELLPPVSYDPYAPRQEYRGGLIENPQVRSRNPALCDQIEPPCAPAPLCPPPKKNIHHVFIQPPSSQPALAAAPQQQVPAGAFLAPPQAGSVVSEQSSVGVSGLRLRIPALTLELPSIELPHIFRRGRAARMELDTATANYVAGAGVNPAAATMASYTASPAASPPYATNAAPAFAPARAPARCDSPGEGAPAQAPGNQAQANEQLQRDYDELQRRCERLEQMLIRMHDAQMMLAPAQCAQPQPCPPPAANSTRSSRLTIP